MEKPNTIPWPPILYLTAIVAGFVLQSFVPLPWLFRFFAEFLQMAGILMILGGLFLDIMTFVELRRHDTTILPTKAASHLVVTGPFALSRNPIYLGNTILVIGIGLVAGNAWHLIFAVTAAIGTNFLAIKPEEAHLETRFGSHFRQYRKRVRRWI